MIGRLQNLAQRFPDIAKVMKWFHVLCGLQAKKKLLHVDCGPVILRDYKITTFPTPTYMFIVHISYLRSVPLETQCKEDHSSISNSAAMFKRWFIIIFTGIIMVQSLTHYWTFKTFSANFVAPEKNHLCHLFCKHLNNWYSCYILYQILSEKSSRANGQVCGEHARQWSSE